MRSIRMLVALITALGAVPAVVEAESMQFKLLPNYSRAVFRTDAPLETVEGHTVPAGLTGTLTVDPAKPQDAKGSVRVDMSQVRTGIEKRDRDMLDKGFLDVAANESNKFVTFEVKRVEIAGPLQPGKDVPAKIAGVLTIKGIPRDVVADGRVSYFRLTPEQVEAQKRFGFQSDNIKVRAKLESVFTNHGMQVPQLLFLKVANEIQLEADLVFVKQ